MHYSIPTMITLLAVAIWFWAGLLSGAVNEQHRIVINGGFDHNGRHYIVTRGE